MTSTATRTAILTAYVKISNQDLLWEKIERVGLKLQKQLPIE